MGKRSASYTTKEEEKKDDRIMGIPKNILIAVVIIAFVGGSFVYFTFTSTDVNTPETESEFVKQITDNTYDMVYAFGNTTDSATLNISADSSEVAAMVFGNIYGTIDDIMNSTIDGVEGITGEQWGSNIVFKFKVSPNVPNVTENIEAAVGDYLGMHKIYRAYVGRFTSGIAPNNINEVYLLSEKKLNIGDIAVANAENVYIQQKGDQIMKIVSIEGYKIQSGDTGIDALVVNVTGATFSGKIRSDFDLKSLNNNINASINYNPPKIPVDSALSQTDINSLNGMGEVSAKITVNASTKITVNLTNVSGNETESYINSMKAKIKEIIGGLELRGESDPAQKTDKVTIIEYSDFQCPFCSRAVPTIHEIENAYGDKVEVIFKQFPLSFHENAQKAAEASECARDQGKFWEYHDKLFANQNALKVENLKQYAKDLGLNSETFDKCLDGGEKEATIKSDMQEGSGKGVTGTPAFFVNEEFVSGAQPFDVFKGIIDKKLKGTPDNVFILDAAISSETESRLKNLTGIESVAVVAGKTEITFNNSLEKIKSLLGAKTIPYAVTDGSLSFTITDDAKINSTKKMLESFNVKEIEVTNNGFVSIPRVVLLSGVVTSLRDNSGRYINKYYQAILNPGTKIGDRIKVEIGATIQTMTMPDGTTQQRILGLGSAVEMSAQDIKKAEETKELEAETKNEVKEENQKMKTAIIETNKGTIKFELYEDKAPKTVANFIKLAKDRFYEGLVFHRVIPGFMIQGGGFYPDGTQKESPYGAINLEINPKLVHGDGAVAMARTSDPNSATSQFYICDGPQNSLDGNYAVFGKVTEGMDIVRSIANVKTTTKYQYYADWPEDDVVIKSVTILDAA